MASSLLPPITWRNPPLYPSAKNVVAQDTNLRGRSIFETIKKVVTFETETTVEEVLAYYDQSLRIAGWQEGYGQGLNTVRFVTHKGALLLPGPMYTFQASATRPNSGSTKVELRLGYEPGR
jgi:hypothetical protein